MTAATKALADDVVEALRLARKIADALVDIPGAPDIRYLGFATNLTVQRWLDGLTAGEARPAGPDPYPVGMVVRVRDHDGSIIAGLFLVVRSYWPSPAAEIVPATQEPGEPFAVRPGSYMIRQHHDRIISQATVAAVAEELGR